MKTTCWHCRACSRGRRVCGCRLGRWGWGVDGGPVLLSAEATQQRAPCEDLSLDYPRPASSAALSLGRWLVRRARERRKAPAPTAPVVPVDSGPFYVWRTVLSDDGTQVGTDIPWSPTGMVPVGPVLPAISSRFVMEPVHRQAEQSDDSSGWVIAAPNVIREACRMARVTQRALVATTEGGRSVWLVDLRAVIYAALRARGWTLMQIARTMGGRDHSCVCGALKPARLARARARYPEIVAELDKRSDR